MEIISLRQIHKSNRKITYTFSVSDGLKKYFKEYPFSIEYPENIELVPDAIAAVPFVGNVLPIVWLTNAKLTLKELDKTFFECIPEVRKGYEAMFPESEFSGAIEVANIVPCMIPATGETATFFSGGLDAVHTMTRHVSEKPALISIWGADIKYENVEGWNLVHSGIREYSQKYGLDDVVIRSSFREFDNEIELDQTFSKQLKDGWWHGVKNGIGLLCHAAPYAWLHGLFRVYIASSYCPKDEPVRCASHPTIDNHVRYANCQVVHDGYECSRQDKVNQVVDYVTTSGNAVSLHVCWESQDGRNCCHCEKCYRTMAGLIAADADPIQYGFEHARKMMPLMQKKLLGGILTEELSKQFWIHIQSAMRKKRGRIKKTPYWDSVKWMVKSDFSRPETLRRKPLSYRMRKKLARHRFYQKLHDLKGKFKNM